MITLFVRLLLIYGDGHLSVAVLIEAKLGGGLYFSQIRRWETKNARQGERQKGIRIIGIHFPTCLTFHFQNGGLGC